jgi:hypothetical protein
MSWNIVKVFDDRACANSMGCLQGPGGDFQHLTECADGVSSHPRGGIRTRISHHDDPQRVAPTGIAVGREYAQNAFGDGMGLIPCRNDNPDRLDFRR